MELQNKHKMTCHYFSEETGEYLFARDLVPECGEDFCDGCGDCLSCFGDEECGNGGQHYWAQYIDK